MSPIQFRDQNLVLRAPEPNPTGEVIGDLPVHVAKMAVISCWKMSWRERWNALWSGKLWCHVVTMSGTQPPMAFSVVDEYFVPRPSIPKCFQRFAKMDRRFDEAVFVKHDMVVPQYPHLTERVLVGEYTGSMLTAYHGCLYHFCEERAADDVATSNHWHPTRQGRWHTLDEIEEMRVTMNA